MDHIYLNFIFPYSFVVFKILILKIHKKKEGKHARSVTTILETQHMLYLIYIGLILSN